MLGLLQQPKNMFMASSVWLWLYPWRAFADGAAHGNVCAVINEWQLNMVGELEKSLSPSNGNSGEELNFEEPKFEIPQSFLNWSWLLHRSVGISHL